MIFALCAIVATKNAAYEVITCHVEVHRPTALHMTLTYPSRAAFHPHHLSSKSAPIAAHHRFKELFSLISGSAQPWICCQPDLHYASSLSTPTPHLAAARAAYVTCGMAEIMTARLVVCRRVARCPHHAASAD